MTSIIANNNPETVSTDFDTADRLYFDPLTHGGCRRTSSRPRSLAESWSQFGGQTAIKLTKFLERERRQHPRHTAPTRSTRRRTASALTSCSSCCDIPRPAGLHGHDDRGGSARSPTASAIRCCMRPSYVLGGQNMIIAYHRRRTSRSTWRSSLSHNIENPVLIDKYLMGIELEVDAICDGKDIPHPGHHGARRARRRPLRRLDRGVSVMEHK